MMPQHSAFAAVIGGGASGLICALRAAQRYPGRRIVILERADRVGKKLLVTGNGRCNLTNLSASPAAYHGAGSEALINILFKKYNPASVVDFFHRLGLLTYADDQARVYPRTNLASSVLDTLRLHLRRCGVEEHCDAEIREIRSVDGAYAITLSDALIRAERLIVACGGCADYAGRTGGAADIPRLLGLPITALSPSLSPVKVRGDALRALKGIRADACVSLIRNGAVVKSERGEVQFTDGALSGICVFNLSREANRGGCALGLNLLPDLRSDELRGEMRRRLSADPDAPVSEIFIGMFHKNIGLFLLKACGIAPTMPCHDISDKELNTLIKAITDSRFTAEPTTDFRKAQVTAGGVKLSEIDPHTFESVRRKGLYIIGEALDIDGDCGGYNLQFAWASGMCAGDCL